MGSNSGQMCVKRLRVGRSLKLRDGAGCAIMCCAGTLWITQEGDARDIFLTAGDSFTFDRPGVAVISVEEGARNEWMDDLGFAVVTLPAILIGSEQPQ